MATLFHQITICGVGLIGGSLALIAREKNLIDRAVGLGCTLTNLEVARNRGMIDLATQDPVEAARGADLVSHRAPDAWLRLSAPRAHQRWFAGRESAPY